VQSHDSVYILVVYPCRCNTIRFCYLS